MTKTKLIASLGSTVAISLLSAPLVQASENPFAMQKITNSIQLAEGMEKGLDGKCGDKMKDAAMDKMDKTKEGKCGEGKCGDKIKDTSVEKMEKTKEGKCGEGKCGDKLKDDAMEMMK
ncbi:MAG: hypothetical protein L3J59_06250 [Methylococcaceae bacterium]|nr:hypothetical protein [Methylococcaceae bacterium]